MSNIWFTSDQHFAHDNVIKLMKRPFSNMSEMEEALIQNHNQLVNNGDRVYHLGDFAWRDHKSFLSRLKGQHYLIKGNHDWKVTTDSGFIWIRDTETIKVNGVSIFMSHYAHRVWPKSHYGAFHLYGHSHGMLDEKYGNWGRSMDVGVDGNDFKPWNVEDVISKLSSKPYSFHHPE